jgi:RimJ/RimL family protein N-acetyltransferase
MYGHRMLLRAGDLDLVMRPYRPDEAKFAVAGFETYEVMKYLFPLRSAQTLPDEEVFLERIRNDQDQFLWAICVVRDGEEIPIGSTSIRIDGMRGLSGIVIYDKSWWGRGIASATHLARTLYAFDVCDLVAIDSKVISDNAGSLRALESVGYCRTGTDYHVKMAAGRVRHAIRLTLVNPSDRAWNYFWGDSDIPTEFLEARSVARAALGRARRIVTLP